MSEPTHDKIRFSHVEALFDTNGIICPDCHGYLIYTIGTHEMECSGCGERFKRPTITLERTPSEDYTSDRSQEKTS